MAGGQGAVFVSMGTLARMNSDELHSLAQALTALPNPVLWKLDPAHLPGKIVHVQRHAPRNYIAALCLQTMWRLYCFRPTEEYHAILVVGAHVSMHDS